MKRLFKCQEKHKEAAQNGRGVQIPPEAGKLLIRMMAFFVLVGLPL